MLDCLFVGCGGFIGAVLRFLMGKLPIKNPAGFPVTTFMINVIGAFAIGCIAALALKNSDLNPRLVLFLKAGICGGFTTFSTFSLETGELLRAGSFVTAIAYVVLSIICGVLAVIAAQYLCR